MTAIAFFHCRPNSHPFQDRQLTLKEPTKIGRSVARCRPSPNNAVFDCKVLSRNHALLWYENGKFYLQDTKSSNGTFVNNQRLSKASEESPAVEVNSCDIVQFGVDVVDNTKKVTHGCIVSQLRLYLPNGDEAKQSNHVWNNQIMDKVPYNNAYPVVQSQDLYQLHQYLQEALHREQMLEQKLALLQRLVVRSHDASEKGWQALIDEDRLLSRLEFLENQLQTFNKTQNEESLQTQLQTIQEEKYVYEKTSKETLRQALQEKLEAVRKLSNLERSLSNTEDECTHLRQMHEQTQNELTELAAVHQGKIKEIQEISEKLQETERKNKDTITELEQRKEEMQQNIEEITQEKETLSNAFETLKDKREKLDQLEHTNNNDLVNNNSLEEQGVQADLGTKLEELLNDSEQITNLINSADVNHNFKVKLQQLQKIQVDMETKEDLIETNHECIEDLKETLILAKEDAIENVNEVEDLREQLKVREAEMETKLNQTTNDLKQQLAQVKNDNECKNATLLELQAYVSKLETTNSELECAHKQEVESRLLAEGEMSKLHEERERQTAVINEASRELQAALSARESLLEREENVRLQVEESELMLNMCHNSSSESTSEAEELEPDDKNSVLPTTFVIFKAKLKELKSKLKDTDRQLLAVQEENFELKDQIESLQTQHTMEKSVPLNVEEVMSELLQATENSVSSSNAQMEEKWQQKLQEKEEALQESSAELKLALQKLAQQEEEFLQLQNELMVTRQTAEAVPQLREEVSSLESSLQERRESCSLLETQLQTNEQSLQNAQKEISTLQGKVEEDAESITKFANETESLQAEVQSQALLATAAYDKEREVRKQLEDDTSQLIAKEEQIARLEDELSICRKEKADVKSDFDALTLSLQEAQREKEEINSELQRLEQSRAEKESALEKELTSNKTLLEESLQEKEKLTSAMGNKDEELAEVTTRCQQLIREREENAMKLEGSLAMRRYSTAAVLIAFVSLLIYLIFGSS
uniref:Sarcolemmal membrane-associated protein n=1 Tax=Phallusia mammillata TaxID=59560 RepID=A0A6F9DTL7_9ASCI|nr:sarcolemmal membrane-associated protein [Phallusia mammillata]